MRAMSGNSFDEKHALWLNTHLDRRTGERRGRLERGHSHAEKLFVSKIWWKMFGHFEHLHPEYELFDYRGRPYFVDFVWLPGYVKFAFEVKGFGPHVSDMDRKQYENELNRETFLQGLGFRVVSIPYDSIVSRPEVIISLLRALLGQYTFESRSVGKLSQIERDILMMAYGLNRPIKPVDIETRLQLNRRTAVRHLQSLTRIGKLHPIAAGNANKVCRYELVLDSTLDFDLLLKE